MKKAGKKSSPATGWLWAPVALLLGLPLLGVWLFGDAPIIVYFDFPPKPGRIEHAPFCLPVFLFLVALICFCILPFVFQALAALRQGGKQSNYAKFSGKFPAWGYAGILLCASAWCLSWSRFQWFASWQPYVFPFLWIGYIIIINAYCHKRTGSCRMLSQTAFFAALFPASAVFWWFFEYLNRFVLNWYYLNVDMFSPVGYIIYATVCFSTVLPAVWSTADLLLSFSFFKRTYGDFIRIRPPVRPGYVAGFVLITASAGLFAIGLLPDFLYPLLWVSPLVMIVCFQVLTGRYHLFVPLVRGDWQRLVCFSLSALVCGFFWEMWNFVSLAKWEYSIPFVDAFKIFEMPLLGYAGYLPFGLECAAAGDIILGLFSQDRFNKSGRADTGFGV